MTNLGLTSGLSMHTIKSVALETITALRFDESEILEALTGHYHRVRNIADCSDPRTAPTRGAAYAKYVAWFHHDSLPHLSFSAPAPMMKSLMRLKMGYTALRCNTEHMIPRTQRTCRLCMSSSDIEDEKHIILECTALHGVRQHPRWSPLFSLPHMADMNLFMNQANHD